MQSMQIVQLNNISSFYCLDEFSFFIILHFCKNYYTNFYISCNLKTCLKYDTITSKWSYVDNMKEHRSDAGCTDYEVKIVVFGGYNHARLKLIEAYDHHETKWTHLPDMISGRYRHGAVSMGNKLFMIGGWNNFHL